jgi:cyclopropane-fatty-acyl-phospholipid synthase
MRVGELVEQLVGRDLPIHVTAWDGTDLGPPDAPAALVVRSRDAIRRIVTAPGELGFARAYVAGDVDIQGDIFEVLSLRERMPEVKLTPTQVLRLVRGMSLTDLRPLPPPPEEIRLRGSRHSRERDAAAVAAHYDVGNDFYRLFLGPTMTYSCAVFEDDDVELDEAQAAKYELICRKLALAPGMRLLDVGCGWGGMVIHAAKHHGVRAVGVTLSRAQQDLASKRVSEAGLSDLVEIRLQDYREVTDGPYDAISSIGMFEHVGEARTAEYFANLHRLLRPQGRLLNHAIARKPTKGRAAAVHPRGFIHRYVFPDGELLEVGSAVSAMQHAGFEVRHEENLREHYARTLRLWVANLERNWDEAVQLTSEARARIWRLYMAGSAVLFEAGEIQIHQVLGTRSDGGRSAMPRRPDWDHEPLTRGSGA